jgi:hypothetical protein
MTTATKTKTKESETLLVEYTKVNTYTFLMPKVPILDEDGKPVTEYSVEHKRDMVRTRKPDPLRLIPGINRVSRFHFNQLNGIEGMTEKAKVGPVFNLISEMDSLFDIINAEKKRTNVNQARAMALDIITKTNDLELLKEWKDDERLGRTGVLSLVDEKIEMLENPAEYIKKNPKRSKLAIAVSKYQ